MAYDPIFRDSIWEAKGNLIIRKGYIEGLNKTYQSITFWDGIPYKWENGLSKYGITPSYVIHSI